MTWDHRYTAFLFGAIGGLAINGLRWVFIANSSEEERPVFDKLYWAQFLGLTLFGGALALAHDLSREISALVALNVGLSVTAIAKAVASELLQGPKKRTRK